MGLTPYLLVGMVASMAKETSKTKLLNAALTVVRAKGFTATRVEDICAAAGVTKGSFFHHFKSKDDLALAAVGHWDELTGELFKQAKYHDFDDPVDRLLGYLEFRKELLVGELQEYTCFLGTIAQEAYMTRPDIVQACGKCIAGHAETLEADIRQAMEKYQVQGEWSAESLALHTQAVIQGSFILAKAKGGALVAADSIDHLYRYIKLLFLPER